MTTVRLKSASLGLAAVLLAAAPLVAAVQPVHAAEAPASDKAAVEAAARAWLAAFVARDGATLDRLTAADFVQNLGDEDTDRAMALGMPVNSPDYRITQIEIDRLEVTVNGDGAQVTGLIRRSESFSGREYYTPMDIVQAWRREAGGWRIVSDKETENS